VTSRDEAIRRALCALQDEISGAEHPGHEILEAYVDGVLTEEQRDGVDRLAARSQVVAEDLADLQAIHDTLAGQPAARRDIRWGRIAAIAAVAASIVAAAAIGMGSFQSRAVPAVSHLADREAQAVQRAIADGRITVAPEVQALIGTSGTLLGGNASATGLRPLAPAGTRVLSARPRFVWTDSGADAYSIAIFDDSFNEVMRSPRIKETTWTPDADLRDDTRYAWQVTAYRGSATDTEPRPPRPEARFMIANAATASDATAAMQRLHDEPLALGIILSQDGFIDDGRAALERAAADPSTADAARRLLASLDQGMPITTKPAQ
jgi:hypothetical protein